MIEMTKFKMASAWSKEEEESAIKKISEVASSYDPLSLGGLGVSDVSRVYMSVCLLVFRL
jgi:hypothetical protein